MLLEEELNKKDGMKNIINKFIENLNNNKRTLYNEDSFKFELAYFLRTYFNDGKDFTIKFEKNIIDEDIILEDTKYEMDLYLIDKNNNKYVIELKYTTKYCSKNKKNRKGKTDLCKEFLLDILFANDLIYNNKGLNKIKKSYCINIFIDKDMYTTTGKEKYPYSNYFTGNNIFLKKDEKELIGKIIKQRKNKKDITFKSLNKDIEIKWEDIKNKDFIDQPYDGDKNNLEPKYYIVEIEK